MTNDIEKSLETVAKGTGIIFIGMIIGTILGLINQILLARFLGVNNYGLFNLAFSLVYITSQIAHFGLVAGLARVIPFHMKRGEKDIIKSNINFSLLFVLFISILIAIIIYIFSKQISVNIFQEYNLDIILKYFVVVIPLYSLAGILGAIIRGFKAPKYKVLIEDISLSLIKIAIFSFFVLIGYKLFGAIVAFCSAIIFTIIISTIIIRKKLFSDISKYKKVPIAKKLLSFSWPLYLSGLTTLLSSQTVVLFIGYYLNSEDVGIYTSSLTIATLLGFIGPAFQYIFLPIVSELFSEKKMENLKSLFKSASKWMFFVVLPMFLFIAIFPKEILQLLYGVEYSEGYLALVILGFGISMYAFTGLTGNMLVGCGHTKLNLATTVITAVVSVSLSVILIPIYGLLGAALAICISYSASNLSSLAFIYITRKMHPYTKDYLKILLAGIGTMIIIYLSKIYLTNFFYGLPLIIFSGSFLLLLYIGLLLPTHFLDENDEVLLMIIEKKLNLKLNFIRRFL